MNHLADTTYQNWLLFDLWLRTNNLMTGGMIVVQEERYILNSERLRAENHGGDDK